jgi:DNA invertase Pin-like site-specific DNA recombinase
MWFVRLCGKFGHFVTSDHLAAGDVLMVTRLDRLARSTRDLLNILAAIAGKKAGFRFLSDAWADTTTAHGRLMLTILGGLAEFERELIRARTGEGRKLAKARGVPATRIFVTFKRPATSPSCLKERSYENLLARCFDQCSRHS